MSFTNKELLSESELRGCELRGWRQLRNRLRARYCTGSFAKGLALVNGIGGVAEAMDHHPDISLTYGDVVVTLLSHDADGVTERDVRLAQQITEVADQLGVTSQDSRLTLVEIGLDTSAGEQLAGFYSALFRSEVKNGEPTDSSGQTPTLWWQLQSSRDEPTDLLNQNFDQRWHFDVWVPYDDAESRLQSVLQAGGRLVSAANAPSYWVVQDAEGNRSCICTTLEL